MCASFLWSSRFEYFYQKSPYKEATQMKTCSISKRVRIVLLAGFALLTVQSRVYADDLDSGSPRHPWCPGNDSHHQGPEMTSTSRSPINHHNRLDGAFAPRPMPGTPKKPLKNPLVRGTKSEIPVLTMVSVQSSDDDQAVAPWYEHLPSSSMP